MPCYDPRDNPSYNDRENERLDAEVIRLSARCQDMTKLLCLAGRAYESNTKPDHTVLIWWGEHKQLDAENGTPWPKVASGSTAASNVLLIEMLEISKTLSEQLTKENEGLRVELDEMQHTAEW